jgi:hypothetical protein
MSFSQLLKHAPRLKLGKSYNFTVQRTVYYAQSPIEKYYQLFYS